MNETNKRQFDPTVCFTFFGSWYATIEKINQNPDGTEKAYQLFKAIAEYSLYGVEPNFEDDILLEVVWISLEKEIDISIGKRKRGFANVENDKIYQSVLTALVKYPNKTLREIAEMTASNKDTVNRLKKRYKSQIDKAIAEGKDFVFDNGTVNVIDSVIDIDNDIDNDSMRQDRDKTERQICLLDKIRNTMTANPDIVIDNKSTDYMSPEDISTMKEEEKMLLEYIDEESESMWVDYGDMPF